MERMRGNRYHPLPDKCCMKCKYSELMAGGKLKCRNEDSFYFEYDMAKKDHCPDFEAERKRP